MSTDGEQIVCNEGRPIPGEPKLDETTVNETDLEGVVLSLLEQVCISFDALDEAEFQVFGTPQHIGGDEMREQIEQVLLNGPFSYVKDMTSKGEPGAQPPDWKTMADDLYDLTVWMLSRFKEQCDQTEEFCFVTFRCYSEFGDVQICLTTKEFVESQNREFLRTFGETDDWRENPSYWKYERINYSSDNKAVWFDAWNKHKHSVAQAVEKDWATKQDYDSAYRFLDVCCEVMLRLERNGAFNDLKLSEDFCVNVCDNDWSEYADEKLAEMRSAERYEKGEN